jgi:hypothetical protein
MARGATLASMLPRAIFGRRAGLATALAFFLPRPAGAVRVLDRVTGDPVYTGQAMVTGTDNRDRPRGLRLCLTEVLIKASGDPNIGTAKNFAAVIAQAPDMAVAIAYHDRMSGLPKHDEQGTRDRPFILTALFDASAVATALKALGSAVWTGRRPTVFLSVQVHAYAGAFALLAGPATGYEQPELMRAAVADSAARAALPVLLPASAGAAPPAGCLPVTGSLVWSDAALGWIARWQAGWSGRRAAWGEHGVSFDDAFDAALIGALGIASGHQPPLP